MIAILQIPLVPRWRPYLGQQPDPAPVSVPPPPPPPAAPIPVQQAPLPAVEAPPPPALPAQPPPVVVSGWEADVKTRLTSAGIGAVIGLLIGAGSILLVPSGKLPRRDAGLMALLGGIMAAAATFIPLGKSRVIDSVSTVGGALAGGAAVQIAFPRKK